MNQNDSQLAQDYIDGDSKSLTVLIEKYVDPIYNFAYRITQDSEMASDITQETFIKVWKNIKKYNTDKSFKTWIYSIAKNTTTDWLRKRKNIHFSDLDYGEFSVENNIPDSGLLPDEVVILSENKSVIQKLVSSLPPLDQTIISLRYTEEMSFKEIAEVMGSRENTVKSWHRRAIIKLKSLLSATKLQINS